MRKSFSNLINKKFLYLIGSYNELAPSCTIMTEDKKLIQLDQKSEDIINASLNFLGYDFRGAVRGAKYIVGNKKQCPIMLNPVHSVCIFPHISKKRKELYWFNLDYIDLTRAKGSDTEVEFSNGHILLLDTHINNFKAKLQTAEQLKRVTHKRSW
jgi:competence protein ComK